jgi:endonuclease/exonuclease/phosphatase (EEP) superfamily protein YafD
MREGERAERSRLTFFGLACAGGAVLVATTVAGFLERVWWRFELFAHFRVQYFLGLALVTALALVWRRRWAAATFAAFAGMNLALIAPLYSSADALPPSGTQVLDITLLNVLTSNDRHEDVLAMIRERNPTLLLLMETNERWLSALAPLTERYPHVVSRTRSDNFGIALYSKVPFESAEIVSLGSADVPSVVARFLIEGEPITLIGTHPVPPIRERLALLRNEQLAAVADLAASIEGRVIVLGDLNTSPWSSHFRRLLRDGDLRDSAKGQGLRLTWPAEGALFLLRIPIDHCLISPGLAVLETKVGDAVGSDHLPLHALVAIVDE